MTFTHNGVSGSSGGGVAGDPEAVGAGVEASGSPVHLAAMQGVVLRGDGQGLPFLVHRERGVRKG